MYLVQKRVLDLTLIGCLCLPLLAVAVSGCKTERRSRGQAPQQQAVERAKTEGIEGDAADSAQNVTPKKPTLGGKVEVKLAKARKVINQLTNYGMSVASKQGDSPADLAKMKEALKSEFNLNWPNDPWGKPYVYEKGEGTSFKIFSCGEDGEPGTQDDVSATQR